MEQKEFERKLPHFYQQRSDLSDPEVVLDWVNDTGWESVIYAYSLTSGPAGDRRTERGVLRLLTGTDFESAQREYRTLSFLHEADYPVPKVHGLGNDADGFGHPFILMQRIEGGDFAAGFPQTPEDDQTPLRDFITLFRRLHTLDWRAYGAIQDELAPPGEVYYHFDRQMKLLIEMAAQTGLTALDEAQDWLSEHRGRFRCEWSSLTHRDFHPYNILEDSEGRLFVVDWTSAEISDYRFDLAWTLALILAYGGKGRRDMVQGEYERQMGGKVPELAVFEAAAIVGRIGTVMMSLAVGAEKLGMRPEAVEAMRQGRVPLTRLYDRLRLITGMKLPEIERWLESLV
jgi:aminoglycoside phosphotransferase (APT) family kinase protein